MDQSSMTTPPFVNSGSPPIPPLRQPPSRDHGSLGKMLKKVFGPIVVAGFVVFKYLKFLILPVLKFLPVLLKTGGSMILMIGVYGMAYGWWFALGFVLLIFVHECGHLVAARRLGLKVGAPVFIPFMGAFIALKEAPKNAWVEAQVGIGGPLLGALGAFVCYGIYMVTGAPIFRAFAYVGFFLNLFNLAPIGFLDGGRIATAISPWLWLIGAGVIAAMLVLHFNFLLLVILALSLPRLFSLFRKRTAEEQRYFEVTSGQRILMATLYFGLAASLALGMKFILDAEGAR